MEYDSPSRFATFEILRITIPGAYFIFLFLTFLAGFEIHSILLQDPLITTLFFIVGTIIAGLSFYAKESPRKRKAFLTNLPSTYIEERSRTLSSSSPLSEEESRRLYFYIMNHEMPPIVHDKIFFFGMTYQIMINIRRTSFWFGILGISGLIVHVVMDGTTTPSAVAVTAFAWLVYLINVRYDKADKKMQENYADQLFWLDMNKEIVDTLIRRRIKNNP